MGQEETFDDEAPPDDDEYETTYTEAGEEIRVKKEKPAFDDVDEPNKYAGEEEDYDYHGE